MNAAPNRGQKRMEDPMTLEILLVQSHHHLGVGKNGVGFMEEEPRVSNCGAISSGPSTILVGPLRKRSFRGTVYNTRLCNSIGL